MDWESIFSVDDVDIQSFIDFSFYCDTQYLMERVDRAECKLDLSWTPDKILDGLNELAQAAMLHIFVTGGNTGIKADTISSPVMLLLQVILTS